MATHPKPTATYPLNDVKAAVANAGINCFTYSALQGIVDLGMTTTEALAVIASMSESMFYKTMQSQQNPAFFQDVYRVPVRITTAYVKVTNANGHPAIVVSFKEK